MKKLLILMLVLGIASTASAALSWSYSGTYAANQTITVMLSEDTRTDVSELSIAWLDDDGGNAIGGSLTPGTVNPTLTNSKDAGYQGGAYGVGDDAGDLISAYGAAQPPTYASGELYRFTYALPSSIPSSMTFVAYDLTDYGLVSQVDYVGASAVDLPNFTIPEPMTIALLGLGGLFLRRKK
jgi:hypothetical protein